MSRHIKVVLAQTPFGFSAHPTLDDSYPIGLAYLASAAMEAGFPVAVLPMANSTMLEMYAALGAALEGGCDVIGFQMLTCNRTTTIAAAEFVRRISPRTRVILGGPHASALAVDIVRRYPWLYVLRGEAESSFVSFLSWIERGCNSQDGKNCAGLVYHTGGHIEDVAPSLVDRDIDRFRIDHSFFLNDRSRYASMLTTRGCPFACSFCAVSRRKMRERNIVSVVDEVERIAELYPSVKLIRFFDDQMFFDVKRTIALCEELERRRTGLAFSAMARLKPSNSEVSLALDEANFVEVSFGLETASLDVARRMGKAISNEDAEKCISHFSRTNINTYLFLIVGLPGETFDSVLETSKFVMHLQKIKYMFQSNTASIATVYPNTELYELMLKSGKISSDFWFRESFTPLFTLEHDVETLFRMHNTLREHTDCGMIFSSQRALNLQSGHLVNLAAYVARNWFRPEGVRTNRDALRPYLGWLLRAYQLLESGLDGCRPVLHPLSKGKQSLQTILAVFQGGDYHVPERVLHAALLRSLTK